MDGFDISGVPMVFNKPRNTTARNTELSIRAKRKLSRIPSKL